MSTPRQIRDAANGPWELPRWRMRGRTWRAFLSQADADAYVKSLETKTLAESGAHVDVEDPINAIYGGAK